MSFFEELLGLDAGFLSFLEVSTFDVFVFEELSFFEDVFDLAVSYTHLTLPTKLEV